MSFRDGTMPVYDLSFPNAVKQASQFGEVTRELLDRMATHG